MILRAFLALTLCVLIFSKVDGRDFPGYYLKNNGDTIHCNIQYDDREATPNFIAVRVMDSVLKFFPHDISGFGIDGFGDYRSYEVNYHKGNFTALEAPDVFNDSIETRYSFVKVLVAGKYSLFELKESIRAYYFVSENGGQLQELIYRVKRVGMKIEEEKTYKTFLSDLFIKENILFNRENDISKSGYFSRDIVPLILKLNGNTSESKLISKKARLLQFDIFLGAINTEFPTSVDGKYSVQSNTFSGSSTISGGVNLQYFVPTNFRRIAVGISAGFNQYDTELNRADSIGQYGSANYYSWTKYNERFTLKNKVIMIDLYGMYIVNPHNKVKAYLKAGFNTNFSIEKNSVIHISYTSSNRSVRNGNPPQDWTDQGVKIIPLRKTYYNAYAGGGVNFNNHKLEFKYFTPGVLDADYLFKVKMLGVYYYYTVFK